MNLENERPERFGERFGPEQNTQTQTQCTTAPVPIQLRGKAATAAKRAARAAAVEKLVLERLQTGSVILLSKHRDLKVSRQQLLGAMFALQRAGLAEVDLSSRDVTVRLVGACS